MDSKKTKIPDAKEIRNIKLIRNIKFIRNTKFMNTKLAYVYQSYQKCQNYQDTKIIK